MTSLAAKVLLIEDDDSMREAIDRLLEAAGFSCDAFGSADALLERGIDENAVCVVSDQSLPGMTGLDLLAVLHQRQILVPFILITAHDTPGMREKAISSGATAYLAKPFRGTVLLDAVRAAAT